MATHKNRPAYQSIRDQIASSIARGEIIENQQLPTERDMCEQYGVSRITVRHALSLLERDGLIRKRQGQGIFVCPFLYEQPLNGLYTFSDDLIRQNTTAGWKVLSMNLQSANGEIAAKLGLHERALCRVITRLSYADGKVYAHEVLYVPSQLLAGVTAEQLEREDVYRTMERLSGLKRDHANESYEAVLAPVDVLNALGRKAPLSMMKLVRVSYAGDRPIEYSVRHIIGDKFRFRLSLM